jgi:signal transduction histidine kinase
MLVQVIDNGPGVEDPDRVFDAFITTKEKGMGIGLAVSRSIVETHGGRLWAENNKAGGAIFNVALPLSHEGPTTAQTRNMHESAVSSVKHSLLAHGNSFDPE